MKIVFRAALIAAVLGGFMLAGSGEAQASRGGGKQCREYSERVYYHGRRMTAYGIACKGRHGWDVVSRHGPGAFRPAHDIVLGRWVEWREPVRYNAPGFSLTIGSAPVYYHRPTRWEHRHHHHGHDRWDGHDRDRHDHDRHDRWDGHRR